VIPAAWVAVRLIADLRRHPRAWIAVAASFAAVVVLVGGWRLFGPLADPLARPDAASSAGSRVEVVAFLRDDLGAADRAALGAALGDLPGVESVRRVSAAEALGRMRAALGPHARLLDAAEDGLLPPSLEIALAPGADAPARGHRLGERLRALSAVIEVDEIAPRPDRPRAALSARAGVLRATLAAGIAGLAGVALLSVVARPPARRREEIRLMISLGFTRAAAFLPPIGADLLAALAGAGLGLGVLRLGWRIAAGVRPIGLPFLSPHACALALASSLVVGAAAGYLRARVPDPADA
jgi:cell division protein FtsX